MSTCYLDWNAGAPLRPEARAAMLGAMALAGNASSVHRCGRAVRRLIEAARHAVAALAGPGVSPAQVIFTSGATEANALALAGAGPVHWLVPATEHDSVRAYAGTEIAVDRNGIVDPAALDRKAGSGLAIQAVNNETGVIQPVGDLAGRAAAAGLRVHCDAAQAAGKIAIDFHGWGVDTLSLSAHKLGGPAGIGALVVRDGVALQPLLRGGGQERRRRAGTENLLGIVGFGAAAGAALAGLAGYQGLAALRDGLERRIRAVCPAALVHGARVPRVANTSCLSMPGVAAETQVAAFDLDGIAVSAGAACSSGKVQVSHVLKAMGAGEAAGTAVRVSLGWTTQEAEIDRFVAAWQRLWLRTQRAGALAPAV